MTDMNGSAGHGEFEPGVQHGVAIQPLMHTMPTPVTANINVQTLPDGQKIIWLHFEHGTGSTVLCLTTDLAQALGQKLIEQATGLHLAKPSDVPGSNG